MSPQSDPGSEWPHCSGLADAAWLQEINEYGATYEASLASRSLTDQPVAVPGNKVGH